jgi:hypothetical protein
MNISAKAGSPKRADHLAFLHPHQLAFGHGVGRRQTQRLPIQTSLAEKPTLAEYGDHRLLSLLRRHDKFDLALSDVKDCVRRIPLRENYIVLPVIRQRSAAIYGRQK